MTTHLTPLSENGPPILPGCEVLPPMEPAKTQAMGAIRTSKTTKRKATGRFLVLNNFVDFTMGSLSRGEILVWLTLYRDTKGGTARTAQTDLARRSGLSVSTVKRSIRRLRSRGLLKVVSRGGLRKGPSRYRVEPLEKPTAKGSKL